MSLLRRFALAAVLTLGLGVTAQAQGTIPIALQQSVNANGQPLSGALLFLYVAGTVATPQIAFSDVGLTQPLPWPVAADNNGRLPMFYLPSGSVGVRLTDSTGQQQFYYPNMLVIGPSGGGGGGGSSTPTSAILTTGDIKFRMTGEVVAGWVKLNGTTIGSASSGASGRANADTQPLFVYLWTNCNNAHCPIAGGRGATALADFTANKAITLPDMRSRTVWGRDCMDTTPCAGRLVAGDIQSGGGDGVDTPLAFGGFDTSTIAKANIPNYTLNNSLGFSGQTQAWGASQNFVAATGAALGFTTTGGFSIGTPNITVTPSGTITGSVTSGGSGTPLPTMNPFVLGSWYMSL